MFFKVKNATTYLMRSKGQGLAGQVMLGKVLASRDQVALAEGVALSPVEQAELDAYFTQRRAERLAGRESDLSLTEAANIVRRVELLLVGHADTVTATELTQIGDDVRRLTATVRQLQDELTELGPVMVPVVEVPVVTPGEDAPVVVPGEAQEVIVAVPTGDTPVPSLPALPAVDPAPGVKVRKKPSVRERVKAFVTELASAFKHLFGRWS